LASIGLPPSLYADEDCWLDFLENGHLHWHEDPWRFEFDQLSGGQLAALHRFLEGEYGEADVRPPLLAWVRVRVEGRAYHHGQRGGACLAPLGGGPPYHGKQFLAAV